MLTAERRKAVNDLIYLASCAVNGIIPASERIQGMDLETVRDLSRFHSLSSVAYVAVEMAHPTGTDEFLASWETEHFHSVYTETTYDYERSELLGYCEEKGIWYLQLKGIVLKDFYPEMGMRQMGDNDILFDKKHREEVHQWFVDNGYKVENYRRGNHDVYVKDNLMFEMHTELFGAQHEKAWSEYYRGVKDRLIPTAGTGYGRHFSDNDFYIYITMHEYKHYCEGGTGLRSLLDSYVYLKEKRDTLDWNYMNRELKNLGASDFEQVTRNLAVKLFSVGYQPESLSAEESSLLNEIVEAGTFGTAEGHMRRKLEGVNAEANKEGSSTTKASKLKYILRRLFPELAYMREYFPICRYTLLIPFGYIYRIILKSVTKTGKLVAEVKMLWRMQ